MPRGGFNAASSNTVETPISSTSVADGDQFFPLNEHAPRANILEHFVFIDGNGDKIMATAGIVMVEMSSGEGVYHSLHDGSFSAVDAEDRHRRKPSGFGKAESLKVSLSGIVGASGFRCLVTQNSN